jgi:hypothetical protein
VYMLLLSVIFGCEYGSLEDMLKDLIKNNDWGESNLGLTDWIDASS